MGNRKLRYSLIAVEKKLRHPDSPICHPELVSGSQSDNSTGSEKTILINMDSQAPNKVVGEWLATQGYDLVKPEFTFGNSRMDFYMERGKEKFLLEVKGCTLEFDGHCLFPDAPTERGVKHLEELIKAKELGYHAAVLILIQMEEVIDFAPNDETHKAFGDTLRLASSKGVEILCYNCTVTPDSLELKDKVKVIL
ncbi:MAG: DNA/RNA nuclease SfsA [Treponema sp.]|nr:DNA/RNA nuclease SfsA [Treponema sp.]